jgi:hypothetical protein
MPATPKLDLDALPPVPQSIQDELLHTLASCGFVENTAHTADTFKPLNPMNLPRCYHTVRALILRVESEQGSPEDQASLEMEKATRQAERMEKVKK